jgi:hypothetical protein
MSSVYAVEVANSGDTAVVVRLQIVNASNQLHVVTIASR